MQSGRKACVPSKAPRMSLVLCSVVSVGAMSKSGLGEIRLNCRHGYTRAPKATSCANPDEIFPGNH
jgi:hypothetical protein